MAVKTTKTTLGTRKRKTRSKPEKKMCSYCAKEKQVTQFYVSTNPITSSDGKYVNICKTCFKQRCTNVDGTIDVEKFKNILMSIDRPYVSEVLESAISQARKSLEKGKSTTDIIGLYMKNIASLPCYSRLNFVDSLKKEENVLSITGNVISTESKQPPKSTEVYVRQVDDFTVTDEILDLFGEGYSKNMYRKMWRKFEKLKLNYSIQTNLHEEALATYVRFKIKEEEATARGDVNSADKWNKAASDAADKAKLTPKQLTKADLQGGITAISEISKACEEAVDIIEVLPRFKYAPNDAPDFVIWNYINYARRLRGLPECEYSDIYAFYDKKKEEYISQYGDPYGIFEGDTTEKNRPNVEQFIKLPKDYQDSGDD